MKIIEKTYRWSGTLARRGVTRRIILHHAAAVTCSADQIHAWHLANGWSGIGYHFFVRKDGTVYRGRPEDTVGAHAGGSNSDSIGVCFEGSFDKEEMPAVQRRAGTELVAYLKKKYGVTTVQRHSDVNATGCPGTHFPFDAIAYGREAEPSAPSVPAAAASDRKSGAASLLPVLRRGSVGGHVRAVQALLNGYGCASGAVAGIFTSDSALISYTTWAMRIYMAGIFAMGFQIACQQSFMALGQAKVSLLLACLRKIILLIPLIFILPHVLPDAVFGVFLAEPVSDILAATITTITFFARFDKILDRGAAKV